MFKKLSRKGQNIAEYAVLFAIVIGAAFAMQNYIKQRLQGAMAYHSNGFLAATTANDVGNSSLPFEPNRDTTSFSDSSSGMTMTDVRTGNININSLSNATSITTKE
jgi:hypothetical protein